MRYAFLAIFLIAVLFVSLAGQRGKRHSNAPLRLFPDMDEQQILRPQAASDVFADGMASRRPVANTIPLGYAQPGQEQSLAAELEFTGDAQTGYYWTGRKGDYFGDGLPQELGLDEESVLAFMTRGQERYEIHCAICHASSGDGQGVAAQPGRLAGVANLKSERFLAGSYPDGQIFDVITHGKKPGLMIGYGDKITVQDRWAIVAYIRSLQEAENAESFVPEIRNLLEPPAEVSSEKATEDASSDVVFTKPLVD